jgi:hypothetical protein
MVAARVGDEAQRERQRERTVATLLRKIPPEHRASGEAVAAGTGETGPYGEGATPALICRKSLALLRVLYKPMINPHQSCSAEICHSGSSAT